MSAAAPTVEIFTDEASRSVAITAPVALHTLVEPPPGRWVEVVAESSDDRILELASPASTYPGDDIRLYLDHGAPAIGVFPPLADDMSPEIRRRASQPIASLTNIAVVRVWTHLPELPPLAVTVGGKDVPLTGDALRAIPEETGRRALGWPLPAILALAGVAPDASVQIAGAQTISLAPAEIRRAYLKLNQRGEYVVRMWEDGAKAPTREVRGVRKIVVGGS